MRPVSMENHCSYCHSLEFDKNKPDRVLPHGKPQEVVDVLTYFYGAEAVRPPAAAHRSDDQAASTARCQAGARSGARRRRRRPRRRQPANAPFAKRLERVFANDGASTCGYCHRTTRQADGHRASTTTSCPSGCRASGSRWRASTTPRTPTCPAPIAMRAAGSEGSSDVLLPPIANCRECHQGEAASAAVPSTCTMCHVYHQEQGTCPMVPGTVHCRRWAARLCHVCRQQRPVRRPATERCQLTQPGWDDYRASDNCVIEASTWLVCRAKSTRALIVVCVLGVSCLGVTGNAATGECLMAAKPERARPVRRRRGGVCWRSAMGQRPCQPAAAPRTLTAANVTRILQQAVVAARPARRPRRSRWSTASATCSPST